MKSVYVRSKKQLADALTPMSCLNHVAEVKIKTNWWSKITHATKKNEKITTTLQARRAKKTRSLTFYKQRILIVQDQELCTIILSKSHDISIKGHVRVKNTLKSILKICIWSKLQECVETYIQSCIVYQ